MTTPYPLRFTPILKDKVWGGSRLEQLGKSLPTGSQIGESWELADLGSTTPGGGGGEPARSIIANGPLSGSTLHDVIGRWGDALMGSARLTNEGNFPLLIKFLDAREHLSVQVHPSPQYAGSHPDAHLKTECWTILAADPGSRLFVGLKPGLSREELATHIREGTVAQVMHSVEARVGQTHLLPSGTCHALGAGVLVAEVQTPSDTTFRVYDWTREYNRPQRELHIEQALECIDFATPPQPAGLQAGQSQARVVTTEFFTVDHLRLSCEVRPAAGSDANAPLVLIALSGMGEVRDASGRYEPVAFEAGATMLIPAALTASSQIAAGPGSSLLRVAIA